MITLTKFNTRVNGCGQVVTQVKQSGTAAVLAHSIQTHMGKHRGIYERIGASRFPVKVAQGLLRGHRVCVEGAGR